MMTNTTTRNKDDTTTTNHVDPIIQLEQQTPLLRQQLQTTIFKSIHPSTITDDERQIRNNNSEIYNHTCTTTFRMKSIYLLFLNTYSSLGIFILHLISYESIISILLSVGLTLYIHFLILNDDDNNNRDDDDFNGNSMNWVLLTFAVITPIGAAIQMVFARRENALLQISTLRSTMIQLYNSYAIWGWDYQPYNNETDLLQNQTNGRTKSNIDWLEHSDLAMREIFYICDDLTRYVLTSCFFVFCALLRLDTSCVICVPN